ncbi:MAG: hypothetical protein ABI577_18100 [bacterium]
MVPTESKAVRIGGQDYVAEAAMNSCSNVWTASVRSGTRPVATAAGTSAAEALANVIERAERTLLAGTASAQVAE